MRISSRLKGPSCWLQVFIAGVVLVAAVVEAHSANASGTTLRPPPPKKAKILTPTPTPVPTVSDQN